MSSTLAPDASTRGRLLAAGLAAFAAYGFEGATTRAIAAAAGVPQGLVRHHFGSKRGLWWAVLEVGLDALGLELAAREPLSVRDLVDVAPKHAALLRVLVHGLLEPTLERAQLVERLDPIWKRLRSLHHAARGTAATDVELVMWLGGLLALPVIAAAFAPELGTTIPERRVQRETLASWLIDATPSIAQGPWSLGAARVRLRGG